MKKKTAFSKVQVAFRKSQFQISGQARQRKANLIIFKAGASVLHRTQASFWQYKLLASGGKFFGNAKKSSQPLVIHFPREKINFGGRRLNSKFAGQLQSNPFLRKIYQRPETSGSMVHFYRPVSEDVVSVSGNW